MPGEFFIRHLNRLTGPYPIAQLSSYVLSPSWTTEHKWSEDGVTWHRQLDANHASAQAAEASPSTLPWAIPARPGLTPSPHMRWTPLLAGLMLIPLAFMPLAVANQTIYWPWSLFGKNEIAALMGPLPGIVHLLLGGIGVTIAIIALTTRGNAKAIVEASLAIPCAILLLVILPLGMTPPLDDGVGATLVLGGLGLIALVPAFVATGMRRTAQDRLALRLIGGIAGGLAGALLISSVIVGFSKIGVTSGVLNALEQFSGQKADAAISSRRMVGGSIAIASLLPVLASIILACVAIAPLTNIRKIAGVAWHLAVWPLPLLVIGASLLTTNPPALLSCGLSLLAVLIVQAASLRTLLHPLTGQRTA